MAYAVDTFGGTTGVGGQIGYDFIGLPLEVFGGGEYFFPDCDIESCSLWGGYLEAQLRLPFPLVRPYGLAGITYRSVENLKTSEDTVDSSSAGGLAAGGGLDLNLLALRVFVDARYEFLAEPLEQWVVRVGLNF
jgi:opacity protein-like surface antigen